jgi:alkaline phosphatase
MLRSNALDNICWAHVGAGVKEVVLLMLDIIDRLIYIQHHRVDSAAAAAAATTGVEVPSTTLGVQTNPDPANTLNTAAAAAPAPCCRC